MRGDKRGPDRRARMKANKEKLSDGCQTTNRPES
jgi:hypothetical protein